MKLKRITGKKIIQLIKETGWGLKRAESLNLVSNYTTVAQTQLLACEKEATDKVNETLSLVKGYTEMAVKETFDEIEKHFIWGQVKVIDLEKGEVEWTMRCISDEKWQTLKQSTLKKYGGE